MKKWIFLALWLLCITAFITGQLSAPPNYHLIPNSQWGNLFGTTFIFGILFFFLMIIFFIKDFNKKDKYNLSLKRLTSRLFITGILASAYLTVTIPFTQKKEGLLFEQSQAVGFQNIFRIIILFGVFTLITLFFTLWQKRFRMVSVLLLVCWIVGSIAGLSSYMILRNDYVCKRADSYIIPKEFDRALDLIAQRMDIDETAGGSIWQSIFNFRNCLDIQYLETNDDLLEAYFEFPKDKNPEYLQGLKIFVNPSLQNYDDLTIAFLLSHEIAHAGQYINEFAINYKINCFESEANAFTSQHSFFLSLNEEEQRSVYARIKDNVNKNPTFQTILLTSKRANESTQACIDLQKKNNLTTEQTNKCSWEGLESKLLQDIKEDTYYQKQCE